MTGSWVTPSVLPDLPSALMQLAVDDLRKAENSQDYYIDMGEWHTPRVKAYNKVVCKICMAGAVMAMSMGVSIDKDLVPSNFTDEEDHKLMAINAFRQGFMQTGCQHMGLDWPVEERYMPATPYGNSRELFYRQMDDIIAKLKSRGM